MEFKTAGVLLGFASVLALAGDVVIDDCRYKDDRTAEAAWRPMRGTAPAGVAEMDNRKVLRLPCNFAGNDDERASWDRAVTLDLASSRGVEFKFFSRNLAPMAHFSFYFQSGDGWYSASFEPELTGAWNTITIDKSSTRSEGKPAGWGNIQKIRISAWRGLNENTGIYIKDLRVAGVLSADALVAAGIAQIGHIGGYQDFDEAALKIARAGKSDKRVAAAIADARQLRENALALERKRNLPGASGQAAEARKRLAEAFCMLQRPVPGEFRAFWCHKAYGVEGMDWDEAIRRLAENGFTAIVPNMLWGGAAFYDSKVLPVAAEVKDKGDAVAKCLAACKKYGIQMHVWKVNWNLGSYVPAEFVERMRREGRLQASSSGQEERWLCPSNPENQKLEIAAMVELARNYDVDGIHFDYIRYPNTDHCFCTHCRERFTKATGAPAENWPRDVLDRGRSRQAWLDWRRSNITTVVKAVSEQARAVRPKIEISAAVFRNWQVDRDKVGQDWKLWCEKGYLDFVCPMDYTGSDRQFDAWVTSQKEWAGKVPVYPGIGASSSSSKLTPDRVIGQIEIARRHKTNGFIIFNYNANEARDLLPMLGLGITKKNR